MYFLVKFYLELNGKKSGKSEDLDKLNLLTNYLEYFQETHYPNNDILNISRYKIIPKSFKLTIYF